MGVVKLSKATRAVQEIAEQLSLERLKEELMRQVNDLRTKKQRRIDELEAENRRLLQKAEVKLAEPAAVGRSSDKPAEESKKDYGNTICFSCGQKGHTSIVCRKKNTLKHLPTTEGAGVRVPTEKKVCYICGLTGHFFRDCPLKVTQPVEDGKTQTKLIKQLRAAHWDGPRNKITWKSRSTGDTTTVCTTREVTSPSFRKLW